MKRLDHPAEAPKVAHLSCACGETLAISEPPAAQRSFCDEHEHHGGILTVYTMRWNRNTNRLEPAAPNPKGKSS